VGTENEKANMVLYSLLLAIWILLLPLSVNYNFAYMHEAAHVQISKYFGFEAEMDVPPSSMLTGQAEFHVKYPLDKNMTENERVAFLSLHSTNEIVGYNTTCVLQIIWLFGLLYFSKNLLDVVLA
jgi:hypothetical protein